VKLWPRIDRTLTTLINGSGILSGFFILLTALLIAFEVVMRYLFLAPTVWTFDITLFLILYSAYVGSAFTMREGKHVRVEFFMARIARNRPIFLGLGILTNVTMGLFWVLVVWRTFEEGISAYRLSEATLSYLRFPMTIPLAAIFLGGLLVIAQLVLDVTRQIRELLR
jgi:C4-dicarboxylate transporter DctQ subunit